MSIGGSTGLRPPHRPLCRSIGRSRPRVHAAGTSAGVCPRTRWPRARV